MENSSTLFLKLVIYSLGLLVAGICILMLGGIVTGNAGMYLPLLAGMCVTAIPFLYALYQGVLLLRYIDANTAFSEQSVKAIRTIKSCAGAISVIYALMMPLIIHIADKDDAPGVVLLGLVFIFAPFVTAVFAAVLEKLLRNAIDIKSENDLTV